MAGTGAPEKSRSRLCGYGTRKPCHKQATVRRVVKRNGRPWLTFYLCDLHIERFDRIWAGSGR